MFRLVQTNELWKGRTTDKRGDGIVGVVCVVDLVASSCRIGASVAWGQTRVNLLFIFGLFFVFFWAAERAHAVRAQRKENQFLEEEQHL